jgi:uncharacterized protein YbjT (DUF2867 family)
MNILLTGATGYIGSRLLPLLVQKGHHVYCCVRDKKRFQLAPGIRKEKVTVIEHDFSLVSDQPSLPKHIDGAYYLIHSMSTGVNNYDELEKACAENFVTELNATQAKHVVYLSGISHENTLSKHLQSRKTVENTLCAGNFHTTTLRAGIIIGSGSASYEIMRDLVEKLPIMITPKWLNTLCQPIGVADVINMLKKALFNTRVFDKSYDIGGPDVLTYKDLLLKYAEIRGLNRAIYTVPVMTPRLSSYWLYFITSTNYNLASALVQSLKVPVTCRDEEINSLLVYKPISVTEAIKRTLRAIDSNNIVSSWKDALSSSVMRRDLSHYIKVPTHGCFIDSRSRELLFPNYSLTKIWSIGGENGWYKANYLWKLRGFLDKFFGGVGLRRGRKHPKEINTGDVLDFWRVIYANKNERRLLLYAEMKLPGEAWLEFHIHDNKVTQTATFRPKGIVGRMYWYAVWPFHQYIFNGMLASISGFSKKIKPQTEVQENTIFETVY